MVEFSPIFQRGKLVAFVLSTPELIRFLDLLKKKNQIYHSTLVMAQVDFSDLQKYDKTEAWPLILDNFVEWLNEKSNR